MIFESNEKLSATSQMLSPALTDSSGCYKNFMLFMLYYTTKCYCKMIYDHDIDNKALKGKP